jgi:multicomponent Na+:H+ antiporter subunit E
MPLNPDILRLPLILPPGAPTWWLMLTITLLPGTLSVRLHTDRVLEVHCLDADAGIAASVRRTERQLAELFGLPPTVSAPDSGSADS